MLTTAATAAAVSATDAIVSNFRELYERVHLLESTVNHLREKMMTIKGEGEESLR